MNDVSQLSVRGKGTLIKQKVNGQKTFWWTYIYVNRAVLTTTIGEENLVFKEIILLIITSRIGDPLWRTEINIVT